MLAAINLSVRGLPCGPGHLRSACAGSQELLPLSRALSFDFHPFWGTGEWNLTQSCARSIKDYSLLSLFFRLETKRLPRREVAESSGAVEMHAGLATNGLRTFRKGGWHRLTMSHYHVPICPNFGGYIGFIGIH